MHFKQKTCLLRLLIHCRKGAFLQPSSSLIPIYAPLQAQSKPTAASTRTIWSYHGPVPSRARSGVAWRYFALLVVGMTNRFASRLRQLSELNSRHRNSLGPRSSRRLSGMPRGPRDKPPLLMEFPLIAWPSMIKTLRNWILTTFIIRPYLDGHFNHKEFLAGAKQALVTISSHLSGGHFDALEGLVSSEAVTEIQRNYSVLNVNQRQNLAVKLDDIYFCFLYQIGIIMDDRTDQRFAEITVVYHCLHGLEEITEQDPLFQTMEKYKEHITVCNYRFIREYTKGVESDWTVNKLNHFKPSHFE